MLPNVGDPPETQREDTEEPNNLVRMLVYPDGG